MFSGTLCLSQRRWTLTTAFLKPEDVIDDVMIKIMTVDNIWDKLGVPGRLSLRVLGSLGQILGTNTQPRVL